MFSSFRFRASIRCPFWQTRTSHSIDSRTGPSSMTPKSCQPMHPPTVQCGQQTPLWITAQSIQLWRQTKAQLRHRKFSTILQPTKRYTNDIRHIRQHITTPMWQQHTMDPHWSSFKFTKMKRVTHQANRWVKIQHKIRKSSFCDWENGSWLSRFWLKSRRRCRDGNENNPRTLKMENWRRFKTKSFKFYDRKLIVNCFCVSRRKFIKFQLRHWTILDHIRISSLACCRLDSSDICMTLLIN